LLRQYLPKGIDISSYSQAKLNAMARQLNERPRKTLGYRTPAEMFSQTVASTGESAVESSRRSRWLLTANTRRRQVTVSAGADAERRLAECAQ
jgi:hypothetical protein